MASTFAPSLNPAEITFLCEMELVTVIPRQRMDSVQLLTGLIPALKPPYQTNLPLWLALLLKQQRRASIIPPPWLNASSLQTILDDELSSSSQDSFTESVRLDATAHPRTPPFQPSSTVTGAIEDLPYHWQELGQILLAKASDDFSDAEQVRRLLRDLREVRMAKVRTKISRLQAGAGMEMTGIGAMEVGESRLFLTGVIDGLRKIGASSEAVNKEIEEEARETGLGGDGMDEDEDML